VAVTGGSYKEVAMGLRRPAALALTTALVIVALAPAGARGQALVVRPLGPLPPVPVPPDNPMTPAKVELGRLLFWDDRLSGDVSTPCGACHDPERGYGDGRDVSRGYPGTDHWRNSQTVLNAAYYQKLFWAGEVTSLEGQAVSAATGNVAGNGDPMMMEERLRQVPEYVRRFRQVFGTARPHIHHAWQAIAAFERTLVSNADDVPFDRYAKGDRTALSPEARRGLALFQGKAGCLRCHHGPLASDESFHNLGLPGNSSFATDPLRQITLRFQHASRGVPESVYRTADRDLGLYYTTKRDADRGKFRTPSLRELKYTAPYMHNGVFRTLEEVVDFYDAGGGADPNKSPLVRRLGLTAEEKRELVAFLLSLSSDRPPHQMPRPEMPPYAPLTRETMR
jgi:cytochrome c peroxidase